MKRPKWHAKVFSIIVVLAFALGLVPVTAIPVAANSGSLIVEPGYYPCYPPYYYEDGMRDNIGWNVLTDTAFMWVPNDCRGDVLSWDVSGDGHMVAGGDTWPAIGRNHLPGNYSNCVGASVFDWIEVVNDGIDVGEVLVTAYMDPNCDGEYEYTLTGTKKWGTIDETEIQIIEGYDPVNDEWVYSDCPGESQVMWYEGKRTIFLPGTLAYDVSDESCGGTYTKGPGNKKKIDVEKEMLGMASFSEKVIGTFEGGIHHAADGAEVHMFLLDASAPIGNLTDKCVSAYALIEEISALQEDYPSWCVGFYDGKPFCGDYCPFNDDGQKIHVTKTSRSLDLDMSGDITEDEMGWTCNILMAKCEEAVWLILVATYPETMGPETCVFVEICSFNFWTQQLAPAPQVRWVGEKIVLEKQFGFGYQGWPVVFNLEEGACGSLYPIELEDGEHKMPGRNQGGGDSGGSSAHGAQQVLTECDKHGVARAILESNYPCMSTVTCSLYLKEQGPPGPNFGKGGGGGCDCCKVNLPNQAVWVVYFLKFEGLSLSNVQGEREGHNEGLWDPVLDSGMITSATETSMTDSTRSWTTNFSGKTVKVWKGEWTPDDNDGYVKFIGDLQIREIVSNTDDTVYIDPDRPWDKIPNPPNDVEWYYMIVDPVWNPDTDDLSQELNVSQDALLRVRVKGWFLDEYDLSWRESVVVDLDGDGFKETRLPEGRWVLPDDWPILAGAEWQEFRPEWDIMDQPNDEIMSEFNDLVDYPYHIRDYWTGEAGNYYEWILEEDFDALDKIGDLVAQFPVCGPYSTLDTYDPYIMEPCKLNYKTIVRNGKLNFWDCPMPPAKIIFKIKEGAGFFKDCDKGDVYYQWVNNASGEGIAYTNPYYFEMIPSSRFIPPFCLTHGYDWDSWDEDKYGPYPFWEIFNQLPLATPDDPAHPTKVEVYSDNHGEAMVWLNGDLNLDLAYWWTGTAYDIPTGTLVGNTTVKAIADYPYIRTHKNVVSNTVEKTWTWGKSILGADPHEYIDHSLDPFDTRMVFQVGELDANGYSDFKMPFIWVSDRDGMPAVGEKIEWSLVPGGIAGAQIFDYDSLGNGVSEELPDINTEDGFLVGTLVSPKGEVGGVIAGTEGAKGISFARLPTDAEKALFKKFQDLGDYPDYLDVNDYAVAAIIVYSSFDTAYDLTISLYEREGKVVRDTNLNFSHLVPPDPADDPPDVYKKGDVNDDDEVNVYDMIKIVQRFGETGAAGWIPEDVYEDGAINILDLIAVAQLFD